MSDETQHTEGPWHVFPRLKEGTDNDGRIHVGPGSHSIAVLLEDENPEANARLIAAAPDLLRLMKRVRDHLAPLAVSHSHIIPAELIEELNDALAKAEGRDE